MKIIFWNIGKNLSVEKNALIKKLLDHEVPNIVCIAEGSRSQKDCERIEKLFLESRYKIYYSPSIGKEKLEIKFIPNGLKVFYKDCLPKEAFDFHHLRVDGRIVRVVLNKEQKRISLVFLHNYSKRGNRESTLNQSLFLNDLKQLVTNEQSNDNNILVVGDFNLEPWDNYLRTSDLINSVFISKHLSWAETKNRKSYLFYNPLAENLINDKNSLIGGTFFSKDFGWALYDYPIYNKQSIDLEFKIISKINKVEFFKKSSAKCDNFEKHDFDHLPILIKLN